MKQDLSTNILKEHAETMVVFEPVAQNTVVRPMAEAVCMAQGGETVQYTDTATHQKKSITLLDLYGVRLQTTDKTNQRLDGYKAALMAKHLPVLVCVKVNDVQVFVSKKTTLEQAMADFHQKIRSRQYE